VIWSWIANDGISEHIPTTFPPPFLPIPQTLQFTHCPTCQCQEPTRRPKPKRVSSPTCAHGAVRFSLLALPPNTHPLILQPTESSVPPTALATLITAQHFRPLQKLPMLFVPVLLFSSYLNLNGFPVDSAGVTSAWSAAYLVVARRRKQAFSSKFGARGAVRGLTLGLCAANIVSGGLAYAFGKREARDE
jgi:hypothetical protein